MIALISGEGREVVKDVIRIEPIDAPQEARNRVKLIAVDSKGETGEIIVDLNRDRVELLPENTY
jgi:hypothetical protein